MSEEARQRVTTWLLAAGAVGLFVSLFVDWRSGRGNFLILFGSLDRLGGFFATGDRSAWDAYTVASVLLTGLAAGLLAAAVIRDRRLRCVIGVLTLAALAFAIHVLVNDPGGVATPRAPIGGTGVPDPAVLRRLADAASVPGPGVTVAIVSLTVAALALALGLLAERARAGDE